MTDKNYLQTVLILLLQLELMKDKQQSHLLLIVKSLTQNREEKNYIISVENHNINNKVNIQNVFTHNYQYVYKLWPCQPASRELLKISMFEKVAKGTDITIVKRGEASPLVKYSQAGQRFQFYGSFDQKCVLVMKFRVETKQSIEEDINKGQLERLNISLQRELQMNKDQSLNYKNYLEYTNRLIQTLSFQHIAQKNDIFNKYPNLQQSGSIYLKDKFRTISEPKAAQGAQTLKKGYEVGSLYSLKNKRKIYTKDIYLNSTLDIDMANLNPLGDNSTWSKNEVEKQEFNKDSSQNFQSPMLTKRMEVPSEIKKRRQRYFDQEIEPIIKRPSQQPTLFFEDQGEGKLNNPSYRTNQETGHSQLYAQSIGDIQMSFSKIGYQKIAEGKQFGSIRRKKAPISQSKSGISPIIQQDVPNTSNEDHKIEANITNPSVHQKMKDKTQSASYNLTIFNFKAVLYAGNKSYPKKLLIIFQENRYSTQVKNCVNLSTEWCQRFGIKNCKQNSSLIFILISVGQKERQEGESQVVANDIINCSSRIYRSYFFVDDLAVGYLQFQFQFNQYSSQAEGWKRESSRNTISLPQIKKKNNPSQYSNRRSSLSNIQQRLKASQRLRTINSNKQQQKRRSLGGANYPELSKNQQKVMSKIQEKKMLLKAKLK